MVGLDPSCWRLPHIARLLFVFLMVPFHAFLGVDHEQRAGAGPDPGEPSSAPGADPAGRPAGRRGHPLGAGDLIALVAVLGVLISWASYEEKVVAVREDRRLARERAAGRPARPVTRPPVP